MKLEMSRRRALMLDLGDDITMFAQPIIWQIAVSKHRIENNKRVQLINTIYTHTCYASKQSAH